MPVTARLNDIVEALEMQMDEFSSFLDRDTGQVETVSRDLLREAEECDDDEDVDLPGWQKREWKIKDFAHAVESDGIREDLLHSIHRAGAFRNFKDTIRRHGIEADWFEFRTEALRQIAITWCEENQIVWE